MSCKDLKWLLLLLKAAEEEAERVRQERVKAYEAKKANSMSISLRILFTLFIAVYLFVKILLCDST